MVSMLESAGWNAAVVIICMPGVVWVRVAILYGMARWWSDLRLDRWMQCDIKYLFYLRSF